MPVTQSKPKKFTVLLKCESNDLMGSVQVIALDKDGAASLAKREFFRGEGWHVVSVEKVKL